LDDKAKAMMEDPAHRDKIEQLAMDKGLTVEQAAKEYMVNHNTSTP
jgi:hypothetical protein